MDMRFCWIQDKILQEHFHVFWKPGVTNFLWKYETKYIIFTLVVDDFVIKYTSLENAKHLLNALQAKYTISEDWEAKLYIVITLKWDHIKRTVDLSMPGYVAAALMCFRHQIKNNK